MALDRLDLSQPALSAYLDGLSRVPDDLAALYREMEGHERAQMMTHPELGALLEVLVRATGGRSVTASRSRSACNPGSSGDA